MEYDIHICPTCGLGLVRLSGPVDVQALCDVLNALLDHEDWTPDQNALWDVRQVTDLYVKPDAERRLAELATDLRVGSDEGSTALLARTTSQRAYGTVLLRTIRGEMHSQRTFQSVRRAVQWLRRSAGDSNVGWCSPTCPITSVSSASAPS